MKVTWRPQEDITTYELAKAVTVLVVAAARVPQDELNEAIDALPENVRRHFIFRD